VRAGLELITAVGALRTHAPVQTRIGIATGLVVVGDLIGSDASQEQKPSSAKRRTLLRACKGVAEPNAVVDGLRVLRREHHPHHLTVILIML
jgi:hypothetical protein